MFSHKITKQQKQSFFLIFNMKKNSNNEQVPVVTLAFQYI